MACLTLLLSLSTGASAGALNVSAECRDGVAHGAYRLESDPGGVRIEGRFANGLRDGDFVFYSASGDRTIVLPYTRGLINGTVRAWYHGGDASDADAGLKLLSDISTGFVQGRHQTWYENGKPRSDFVVEQGEVESGRTWGPDGAELDIKNHVEFLNTEIQNDFDYYERLEQVMDAYPPVC